MSGNPFDKAPESILEEAQRIIHGARNKAYGHPRDNFQNIADLWNGYLAGRRDRPIDTMDVANLMILLKVARLNGTGYHRDSVTDIAGYAGTIERLQEPVEEPKPEPRKWDSLDEVPHGVEVQSAGGEYWNWKANVAVPSGGSWVWHTKGQRMNHQLYRTAPFTEVLDG